MSREIMLIKKEGLLEKYPFMESVLGLEKNIIPYDNPVGIFFGLKWQTGEGQFTGEITIEEGVITPHLLERKTHSTESNQKDGLPSHRIYSENPLMPDKEGPVPTYAVKDGVIKKLGLEWQLSDPGYIEDGYNGEARLKPQPDSIQLELIHKHIEDPDFIVSRGRVLNNIRFEIYKKARSIKEIQLFSNYGSVEVLDQSEVDVFLSMPTCSTVNIFEEEEGFNTKFEDSEEITYFCDFSKVDPQTLDFLSYSRSSEGAWLISKNRGNQNISIGEKLKQLTAKGEKITHIIRSSERYGGGTNDSVWTNYLKAQIFVVPDSSY